jgi:hypothetical protein
VSNAIWNFDCAADGTSGAAWSKGRLRDIPDLWQLSDKPALISIYMWGVVGNAQGGIENLNAGPRAFTSDSLRGPF